MKNKFYSHILNLDPVHEKFSQMEVDENEKDRLLRLLHSHIHLTVVDVILTELDEDKKREFLHLITIQEDHTGAWEFVVAYVEGGEGKVKETIDGVIGEFIQDLENENIV